MWGCAVRIANSLRCSATFRRSSGCPKTINRIEARPQPLQRRIRLQPDPGEPLAQFLHCALTHVMTSTTASLISFGCIFGGSLTGIALRSVLPVRYFTNEAKDVLRLGLGLITTLSALVLGLLISTAKSSYDAKRSQLTQIAAAPQRDSEPHLGSGRFFPIASARSSPARTLSATP